MKPIEYLTIKDVCELLQVHRNTITKLCNDGLPFVNIGGRKRFIAETIKQWIIEQSTAKQEPIEKPVKQKARLKTVKLKPVKKLSPVKTDSSSDKTIDDANQAFEEWKRKHYT